MEFEGKYNGSTRNNGKMPFNALFAPDKKVIVFDVDGVLLTEGYNGRTTRASPKLKLHNQAKEVYLRALREFDEVVLWTLSPHSLEFLQNFFPFYECHERIVGAVVDEKYPRILKDLRTVTSNRKNIVAIEDCLDESFPTFFEPQERVILVRRGNDLMQKYLKARALIGK